MSTPTGPPTDDRSRHLVDPELLPLLDLMPTMVQPGGLSAETLQAAREQRDALVAATPPPPGSTTTVERLAVPASTYDEGAPDGSAGR